MHVMQPPLYVGVRDISRASYDGGVKPKRLIK